MAKAPHDVGPIDPQISLAGAVKAIGRAMAKKAPGLSAMHTLVDELEYGRSAERRKLWAEYVCNGEDPDAFAQAIINGLASAEGEFVRAAVLESAQSANEALSDAIVPAIARLTNLYLTTKVPDRRTYRDLLGFLRSLDGEEYAALRSVLPPIKTALTTLGTGIIDTVCTADREMLPIEWSWQVRTKFEPRDGSTPPPATFYSAELLRGEIAYALVTALLRAPGDLFRGRQSNALNAPTFLGGRPPAVTGAGTSIQTASSPSFGDALFNVLATVVI